ncbi:MAG: hypothetical protein ACKO2P_11620 [Planctomycetota bacterium]
MKLSNLPEIAALMSAHSRSFIERRESIPVQTIGDYYVHSRNRFNRWMRLLADHSANLLCTPPPSRRHTLCNASAPHPLTDLAQQIFLNEFAARVWLLLLIAADRFNRRHETEALARNLLGGYQTLRRRTAELVIHNESLAAPQRFMVQDLRKHTESWADLLCCDVIARHDLWSLAYNPDEAQRNAQQRLAGHLPAPDAVAWQFLLEEIRSTFSPHAFPGLHVGSDDRQILRLMLSTFPRIAEHPRIHSGKSA